MEESSNTNNIDQITTNKLQSPKERIWTIPVLLDSPQK